MKNLVNDIMTKPEQVALIIEQCNFISVNEDSSFALAASEFLLKLYIHMGLSIAVEFVHDLDDICESYKTNNGDFFVLFDRDSNEVIGTVAYQLEGEGVANLKRLATNPEYRLKGLGRYMYEEMMMALRERGVKVAKFTTLKSFNMIEAYQRWGFVITTQEPIITGRGPDTEVYMEMNLLP